MFFRDRPRAAAPEGHVNQEYLSLFSDRVPALCGRTPLQCYTQFMVPAPRPPPPPPPTLNPKPLTPLQCYTHTVKFQFMVPGARLRPRRLS